MSIDRYRQSEGDQYQIIRGEDTCRKHPYHQSICEDMGLSVQHRRFALEAGDDPFV